MYLTDREVFFFVGLIVLGLYFLLVGDRYGEKKKDEK